MTAADSPDLAARLVTLWETLAGLGATVRRVDVGQLPADVLDVLCQHEARRIRALLEAETCWTPKAPDVLETQPDTTPTPDPKGPPMHVRFHRPGARSIA